MSPGSHIHHDMPILRMRSFTGSYSLPLPMAIIIQHKTTPDIVAAKSRSAYCLIVQPCQMPKTAMQIPQN
jgi:hypothetical protein